ncbi:MAG: hypothetical protein R3F37_15565 [Candidatus Competibacteraceae bacterium]
MFLKAGPSLSAVGTLVGTGLYGIQQEEVACWCRQSRLNKAVIVYGQFGELRPHRCAIVMITDDEMAPGPQAGNALFQGPIGSRLRAMGQIAGDKA